MKTNLKQIRKDRGYKNAKDFADSIGMQEKTYRNYENGSRNLYLDVACRLCTALDCTLEELTAPDYEYSFISLEKNEEDEEKDELIRLWENADLRARKLAIHILEDGQKSDSVSNQEIA